MILLLQSCSILGTRTLYKTSERLDIHKIGFVDFTTLDKIHNEIYSLAKVKFKNSVPIVFKKYGIDSTLHIIGNLDYFHPDSLQIKSICFNQNIDGLVLSTFAFANINPSSLELPYRLIFDTRSEMKLFDKNGKLIIFTKHNTIWGNTYWNNPSPDKTVYDGIKGNIKRMMKEIKSTTKTKKQ